MTLDKEFSLKKIKLLKKIQTLPSASQRALGKEILKQN